MKKFLSYYRPHQGLFFTDLFFAFLLAGITLIYPLVVRYITNVLFVQQPPDMMQQIFKLALFFLFLAALECLSNFYVAYQGHVMGARMEFDMRKELFAHYQTLSHSFYDNQKTGQLMTRITNDLFDLTELCHHGPEDLLVSLVKFIGAFFILWRINIWLTMLLFLFLPMMFWFALYMKNKMNTAFRKNRERIADINAQIEDNLSGIRVVKSFANESLEMEKFNQGNQNFLESKRNSYWCMAWFHSGLGLFISLINIAAIIGGAALMVKHKILLGDLLTFLLYIANLLDPIKKLINFTEQFQNGITGFERFMEMLEQKPDIVDQKNAIELKQLRGKIEWHNVSFQYEEGAESVLQNIQLTIQPGEYVAIVGPSGVGKTTLLNLLPRFYEIKSGTIFIDDQDIREIKLKSLREKIGTVQQDVYLFTGTILDNIRYGKIDATKEEIIRAAKQANAHQFIEALPNGYETYIGQRGVKLSGGQKQRLSIARVFLKDPSILILDEATSALDNESERLIQSSLEALAKERTTLVIAHRLTTIQKADRIIVLTEEGIIEQGTHQQLLQKKGVYAKLYQMYDTAGKRTDF